MKAICRMYAYLQNVCTISPECVQIICRIYICIMQYSCICFTISNIYFIILTCFTKSNTYTAEFLHVLQNPAEFLHILYKIHENSL